MKIEKKYLNRRQFFSTGLSGIAGTGLWNIINQTTPGKILYRELGRTGIKLPIVNMGVMNAFNPALIKRSYELGIRYFDTAAYYQRGHNEEMVGNVIQELGVRDKVILGTKAYIPHEQRNISSEEKKNFFIKTAEESLKRLKIDTIDIFFVHNVMDISYLNDPGILEAMQLLKKQGKIRFAGFSIHSNMTECIKDAIHSKFYDVIETAFNYAMSDDKELLLTLDSASKQGIGLIAMKTQCTQYWYRDYVPDVKQHYYKGKILHSAVLKWVLQHDFITTAIPGFTTFEQIDADFSVVSDLSLTSEERMFLEDRKVKTSLAYCVQCRTCISTCPKNVDIPALMRTHMYAQCYGNFYQARDAIAEMPENKSLMACDVCTTCRAVCAHQIDIPNRIKELKNRYALLLS